MHSQLLNIEKKLFYQYKGKENAINFNVGMNEIRVEADAK